MDAWYLTLDPSGYLYPSSLPGCILFRRPNAKLLMPSDDLYMPAATGVIPGLTLA